MASPVARLLCGLLAFLPGCVPVLLCVSGVLLCFHFEVWFLSSGTVLDLPEGSTRTLVAAAATGALTLRSSTAFGEGLTISDTRVSGTFLLHKVIDHSFETQFADRQAREEICRTEK